MKFIDVRNALGKARRYVSRPSSTSSEEVKDPVKLAEIIRQLSLRVSELEARSAPPWVEFEKDVTGTVGVPVTVNLDHNLGGPIRFYVTYWRSSATVAPTIVALTTSTNDRLVLRVHSTGRIVIRIEPSQYGIS